MPFYDRGCSSCDWRQEDCYEPVTVSAPHCPTCGNTTERIWISGATNVIGDAIDVWQENGFRHPRHFTSKIERLRALKEAGLREVVKNAGPDDKHCRPWLAMDAHTLENAKALVSRNGTAKASEDAPPLMNIRYVSGELSRG